MLKKLLNRPKKTRSKRHSNSTLTKMPETVLVVGATGTIGISAIIGALRTKRNVLAIVRNSTSADKMFRHVGTREGITTVEANVISEHGVQGVVDKVKSGELPAFQHVYCAGEFIERGRGPTG